jgi:hypothetical protein
MANEYELTETQNQNRAVATIEKIDNGKPALYNPAAFDQLYRAANLFASSDLVPAAYKGKPANCFIAIEMADRMGISPFAVLQSLVIIQGKPSMEAKLIIALVNDSGIFEDPLEYEVVGDDPFAADYKVRAFATMKKTGKKCLGPWIDYRMVKGEGWLSKGGSKWATMPSIMFSYRAASFFAKLYCPQITMGMQTREEMEDVREPVDVTPRQNLATARQVDQIERAAQTAVHAEPAQPLFKGVTDSQNQQQTTAAPARERGKPSQGKQRRNAAEVEEDRLADERDAQAAEAAKQPASDATLTDCPCEHPVSRFDGDREICEVCGDVLSDEGAVQQIEKEQGIQMSNSAPAAQQGGGESDLF